MQDNMSIVLAKDDTTSLAFMKQDIEPLHHTILNLLKAVTLGNKTGVHIELLKITCERPNSFLKF